MALIAICAVVYITLNTLVVLIGLRLCMANRAGKDGVVGGVRVASGTDAGGIAMIRGEPGVIENRP